MKIARSILISLVLAATAFAQLGTDSLGFLEQLGSDVKIDSDNDADFDAEKGAFVWSGNVHMVVQGTELFADRAEFDTKLEEIRVTGNVSIYREGVLYRGERATYRVRTQEIDAAEMRSAFEPVFFSTGELDSNLSEISVVNTVNTTFTTDDNPDPDWFIKAKRIEIYPEDRVVFHSPKLYVGDVPILWLPYLSQPLQEDLGYQFTPGIQQPVGRLPVEPLWHTLGRPLDRPVSARRPHRPRSRRWPEARIPALAQQPELRKIPGVLRATTPILRNPSVNSSAEDRSGLDSDRYRINFHHRVYLPGPEESTLYVDFDINKVSDEFFYEDFFPNDFRLDPQPDNIITLTKQHERGELSVLTRFELNDFYRNDTPVAGNRPRPDSPADFQYRGVLLGEHDLRPVRGQLERLQPEPLAEPGRCPRGRPPTRRPTVRPPVRNRAACACHLPPIRQIRNAAPCWTTFEINWNRTASPASTATTRCSTQSPSVA